MKCFLHASYKQGLSFRFNTAFLKHKSCMPGLKPSIESKNAFAK